MRNTRECYRPQTLEEALRLLSRVDVRRAPLTGCGTYAGLETVVDLSSLPLSYVKTDGDLLRIGALTRLETFSADPSVRAFAGGALAETARTACTSMLRNRETLGGAILSDRLHGELVSALLVLNADLMLHTTNGPITQPMATLLEKPETSEGTAILCEVRIQEPPADSRLQCERIARTPSDRAVISATALTRVVDQIIIECRIAVAGEGLTPARLYSVEAALAGAAARRAAVASVLRQAPIVELPDRDASGAEYRRAMLPVLISRIIRCNGGQW